MTIVSIHTLEPGDYVLWPVVEYGEYNDNLKLVEDKSLVLRVADVIPQNSTIIFYWETDEGGEIVLLPQSVPIGMSLVKLGSVDKGFAIIFPVEHIIVDQNSIS